MSFIAAQGYDLRKNILFQDNKSAILIERNGRNSCTGNSRHINIRYFWVKDRVDKGEVEIEYCPSHLMLADYFTKPLQGKMFHVFRNIIMGYRPISDLLTDISELKERVEDHEMIEKVRSDINDQERAEINEQSDKKAIVRRVTYAQAVAGENKVSQDFH